MWFGFCRVKTRTVCLRSLRLTCHTLPENAGVCLEFEGKAFTLFVTPLRTIRHEYVFADCKKILFV